MYTEGVVGAAQRLDDWPVATSPHVRHGLFAVCKPGPGVEAKVNFEGSRAQLWAPTGPDYGSATLLLDGRSIGTISFGPCAEQPSRVLREFRDLTPGGHGLTIRPSSGKPIPLDCLEAWSE